MNFPLYAGLMTTASVALGFMALPTIQNKVFGSVKHDWLCDELEFDRLDHDGHTIIMKNGKYVRVVKIDGTTYETKSEEHQDNLLKGRSVLLNSLGDDGVILRFFAVKRVRDISYRAEWPTDILRQIGESEAKVFAKTFDLEWYLLFQSASYAKLEKSTKTIQQSLNKEYGLTLLGKGQLLSFVNYLITGTMLDADCLEGISDNISAALPTTDLHFDKVSGNITTSTPKKRISRIISIRAYSESVDGKILADILSLHGELEVMQLIEPQSREKSLFQLTTKRNEQSNALDFMRNTALLEETEAILELINSNSCLLFFTQLTIRISADDISNLNKLQEDIGEILGKKRITWSVDTTNAPNYYFNRFPYNDFQARELKLLNPNLAAIWTFHNSPKGQFTSPWGDQPLRLFSTPIGMNYAFNFHVRDTEGSAGHALIVAPTGSGKSTLMMHLLGGMSKFQNVRSYIFDSNEGARFMVEVMGGDYQSTADMKFNPLDCEDTPENRLHIANLLRVMGDCSEDEIQTFIDTAFDLDRSVRSFNAVVPLAFNKSNQSGKDFARWITDHDGNKGLYADIFNAKSDSLSGVLDQSFMTAINMADALNDDVLAAPLVAHIAGGIKQYAKESNSGFCIFIDEAAKLLSNKGFAHLAKEMYREFRKLGGSVVMAFQDPKAVQDSGIASAVLDNLTTLIFFPNSQANKADYDCFNLSPEQMRFISGGSEIATNRTVLVVKRDASTGFEESAILNIDLQTHGQGLLNHYRSGSKANQDLENLKRQFPDDWRQKIL